MKNETMKTLPPEPKTPLVRYVPEPERLVWVECGCKGENAFCPKCLGLGTLIVEDV